MPGADGSNHGTVSSGMIGMPGEDLNRNREGVSAVEVEVPLPCATTQDSGGAGRVGGRHVGSSVQLPCMYFEVCTYVCI